MARGKHSLLVAVVAVSLLAPASLAQVMELTVWELPIVGSYPEGIGFAVRDSHPFDVLVYFAESGINRIAELDPASNSIREWDVEGAPTSIYVDSSSGTTRVFSTLSQGNAVVMLDLSNSTIAFWPVPTPNSWPKRISGSPIWRRTYPLLWLTERMAGQIAMFAPTTSESASVQDLWAHEPVGAGHETTVLEPTLVEAYRESFLGPELGNSSRIPISGTLSDPFFECPSPSSGGYVEAVAPGCSYAWFVEGLPHIIALDWRNPAGTSFVRFGLPYGTVPNAVDVYSGLRCSSSSTDEVWFTEIGRPSIGRLTSATGDVDLWTIPGGIQPIDLRIGTVVSPGGNFVDVVWFIDRGASTVGYLKPATDEMIIYELPPNTFPISLGIADEWSAATETWFVGGRGNVIGRLKPAVPEVGPDESFGCDFLGHRIVHSGPTLTVEASYRYDGSMGWPISFDVQVLSHEIPVPGFVERSSQLQASSGEGDLTVYDISVTLRYEGTEVVQSDMVRISLSKQPEETRFCYEDIEMIATWTPGP